MSDKDLENAKRQAQAQVDSICEYVAALNVDYDQLEDLKDERDDFLYNIKEAEAEFHNFMTKGYTSKLDCILAWEACETEQNGLDYWEESNDEFDQMLNDAQDFEDRDKVYERIQEDPLSIQVRSGWYSPGDTENSAPEEFEILLCTGGPAVRIVGDLDRGQPSRPRIEYQDWFTPWIEHYIESGERDAVQTYCEQFWYGD